MVFWVSAELHLFIESFEDQLKELKMYSPLKDFYSRLRWFWKTRFPRRNSRNFRQENTRILL